MPEEKCIGIIGCGTLGRIIAEGIISRRAGPYKVVALLDLPDNKDAEAFSKRTGIEFCTDLDKFLKFKPSFCIEASSGKVLKSIAKKCLSSGSNLICLSTGAFMDERWASEISEFAGNVNKIVYIASGAIGGFDLAQSAAKLGCVKVKFTTEKPPRALEGAPGIGSTPLSQSERQVVYAGGVKKAVEGFPQNVNVISSLALSIGSENALEVEIVSDPFLNHNRHTISMEGDFGRSVIMVEGKPSLKNPKSSMLAAYSVLSFLKKISSPVQFG